MMSSADIPAVLVRRGTQASVPVPPPHPNAFIDGIRHPDLWLWDSWIMEAGGTQHLYCLALSREASDGSPIAMSDFNTYPFHYRRFISIDNGWTWRDCGAVLQPGRMADGSDADNVWSGSVLALPGGETLFGYTGISQVAPDRSFVQSVIFAQGSAHGPHDFPDRAQSHPVRDHEAIIAAGYYLPDAERIGHDDGEDGGPILAWRDPFMFEGTDGELHALWSAKLAPRVPCVAHAVLRRDGDKWALDLQAPIRLPDDAEYTQAEVPKLCHDASTGKLHLMISACSRLHESQPDSEVWKELRLYTADGIRGPWVRAYGETATIPDTDTLFGASFLDAVTRDGTARILSPHWSRAGDGRPMTFATVRGIPLN